MHVELLPTFCFSILFPPQVLYFWIYSNSTKVLVSDSKVNQGDWDPIVSFSVLSPQRQPLIVSDKIVYDISNPYGNMKWKHLSALKDLLDNKIMIFVSREATPLS